MYISNICQINQYNHRNDCKKYHMGKLKKLIVKKKVNPLNKRDQADMILFVKLYFFVKKGEQKY